MSFSTDLKGDEGLHLLMFGYLHEVPVVTANPLTHRHMRKRTL